MAFIVPEPSAITIGNAPHIKVCGTLFERGNKAPSQAGDFRIWEPDQNFTFFALLNEYADCGPFFIALYFIFIDTKLKIRQVTIRHRNFAKDWGHGRVRGNFTHAAIRRLSLCQSTNAGGCDRSDDSKHARYLVSQYTTTLLILIRMNPMPNCLD
jgi:hypothetical protein